MWEQVEEEEREGKDRDGERAGDGGGTRRAIGKLIIGVGGSRDESQSARR
jgi:hypothetical protein